jgi:hypothetical protein
MTEYRLNDQQQIEIYHPDLQGYIPMIFLSTPNEGSAVRLNETQEAILGTLQELLTKLTQDNAAKTPFIANINLSIPHQEYSFTFPQGTKRFTFRERGMQNDISDSVRYAYVTGLVSTQVALPSAGLYILEAKVEYEELNLSLDAPLNIYFASSSANHWLSIKYWM